MKDKIENELVYKNCKPCRRGDEVLDSNTLRKLLKKLPTWELVNEGKSIQKRFKFKNFDQTMIFIQKLASVAIEQDHHPDVSFGYNYCSVLFMTHVISNLSENDFICAAKLDEVFAEMYFVN